MAVIAVSPGHYPARPGARGDDLVEHDEALLWQAMISDQLEAFKHTVLRVAPDKLPAKVSQINRQQPSVDLAIEIHFNSAPRKAGKGSETLYYPGSVAGEEWANLIQRALAPFCAPNRGAKEGWYRLDKPGHIDYPGDVEGDEVIDYFLRKTRSTAIILEPYFIHESSRIIANRDVVSQVIAEVIHYHFESMG